MTPGCYLRHCRERAGVSIEQIVARAGTVPYPIAEHERRAWLERIEADDAPITADIADAYFALVDFDAVALTMLLLRYSGLDQRVGVEDEVADVLDLALDQRIPPAIGWSA